jgi:cation diffusion facilitator CzcD-associated flavoprotein CzcO
MKSSCKKIAIIGAGAAGLAAAKWVSNSLLSKQWGVCAKRS